MARKASAPTSTVEELVSYFESKKKVPARKRQILKNG